MKRDFDLLKDKTFLRPCFWKLAYLVANCTFSLRWRSCSWSRHQRRMACGVQKGKRWPQATRPVSGMARQQGVEGSGMAGPGDTLGSPWPPLAIRPCTTLPLTRTLETSRVTLYYTNTYFNGDVMYYHIDNPRRIGQIGVDAHDFINFREWHRKFVTR
jgi:hypothetical protein